jgi:predicted phosphoribosyltransferase
LRFVNRADAGVALARHLQAYAGRADVVVLALPRGGVVVGYEVARALGLALDVHLVRKLGVPGRPELAMGAIASDGTRVLNASLIVRLGISDQEIASTALREERELERRERAYRGERAAVDVRGRTVILVDDGLATGASMRVAALALRAREPARVIVAVPVGAKDVCDMLRPLVDEVVCLDAMRTLPAVGAAYDDFSQTSDDEVCELLARAARRRRIPGMKRLTLALALIALAIPSATATADTDQPASAPTAPAAHHCHHGAGGAANLGVDV